MKSSVSAAVQLLSALLVGGLVVVPEVEARTVNADSLLAQAATQTSYWQDSVNLLQGQINLMNRIERSLYSPQQAEVQGSYREVFFRIGELDRYLAKYGATPKTSCSNLPSAEPKMLVYCELWRSRQNLYTLLDVTQQRLSQLGGIEDALLFPPASGALLSTDVLPQENWQDQPQNGSLVIGNPAKPARNGGDISLPAIAPLPNTIALLKQQKESLLALQSQLPAGYILKDIDFFATTNTRYQYKPTAQEYQTHQAFLAQTNTGLSRLLPKDAYAETATSSSLQPSLKESYPLPQLNQGNAFPNLPLVIQDNQLVFMPEAFNIGLIADLGEEDFAAVQQVDTNHPLLTYRSPNTFKELQQEQRRLIFRKSEKAVASSAPLTLNHLYLVRLIQYELSPEILEQKPLPRWRFGEFNTLTNPQSHDVLVAVKPVQNWIDGGYTLLWQVVDQTSAPKLEDLVNYIPIDLPMRP